MPLPEIATPIYTLSIPSSKKRVKYRPFLVKEQKLLILALENDDQEQILNAITKTISDCLITKVNVKDLSLFDIEYLFLQIRARSISEEIEMKVTCQDDGETTVDVKFMVNDVKVNFPKGHTNIIKLSDELTVEMKYPDLEYFTSLVQHHKYSLTDVENMMPWEREAYVNMLAAHLQKERDRIAEEQRRS